MMLGLSLGLTRVQGGGAAAFSPTVLFSEGAQGAWYDPSDLTSMFQDSGGTTPAAVDSPVGKLNDKSGNGNHLTQATSAARPILRQSGALYYLSFDGVDDKLVGTLPVATLGANISKTMLLALKLNAVSTQIISHFGNTGAGQGFTFYVSTNRIFDQSNGNELVDGAATLNAEVWTGIKVGNNLSIRVDSSVVSVPTAKAAANIINDTFYLGARVDNVFYTNMRFFGQIIVAGTPDPALAEQWLAAKSGVTL